MPQTCRICRHPDRHAIEKALIGGEPLRSIADRWSVSKSALIRHKDSHLPVQLLKATEAAEVSQADKLLDEVRHLQDKAMDILTQAEAAGDLRAALMGVREARSCLELCARIAGQIRDQSVNLNQHLLVQIVVGQELPQSVFGGGGVTE